MGVHLVVRVGGGEVLGVAEHVLHHRGSGCGSDDLCGWDMARMEMNYFFEDAKVDACSPSILSHVRTRKMCACGVSEEGVLFTQLPRLLLEHSSAQSDATLRPQTRNTGEPFKCWGVAKQ